MLTKLEIHLDMVEVRLAQLEDSKLASDLINIQTSVDDKIGIGMHESQDMETPAPYRLNNVIRRTKGGPFIIYNRGRPLSHY